MPNSRAAKAETAKAHESAKGKRPTNVSLNVALLNEAKSLGINVSRACEHGLAEQIAKERGKRWLKENREAIDAYNDYVERNGVPLARFRQF
jgi:antitoxin CcdA